MNVFANHAHVFPENVREEATIERLQQLMNTCGIAEAICFAPFAYQTDHDFAGNDWLAEELKRHSNLYGFGTIDFTRDDMNDQVKHIADLGFKGIKLHPAAQKFAILSSSACEVYEQAQQLGLFLTFHTGVHWHRIRDYDVVDFDEIAYRFPDLRFSMEHVGGYHFFPEALAVLVNNIRKRKVFGGLTSVFTPDHNRFWYLSRERLHEMIQQIGCQQLIFGLDFPYNLERETLLGLETIAQLDISEEERAGILGGNLRKVLFGEEE